MLVRRLPIPAVTALLALALAPAALAAPVDPPATFGVPEAAPGCPDPLLDCTAPSDTTVAPPSGWSKVPVQATLGGADEPGGSGLARIEYSVDGAAPADGAAGDVIPFSTDGDHSLAHRAVDQAGNASGWVLDSFAVDATPPVNTTPAVSPAVVPSFTETITGTDATSGVAAVHWTVDGGPRQNGNPVTITADGAHTLRTWVTDAAGNDSPANTDTVTIDAAPPADTSVISSAWRTAAPATVVLSGTDSGGPATAMEYTLDGGALQTTASGGTVTIPGDGVHTIAHRAVDAVGNHSAWVTDTVRVDATNPVNTTTASALWNDPDQHVIVAGTDATSGVAQVQWQVDGGAVQTHSGASSVDVQVTGDGVHTVKTQVVDVAGNASGWRTDTVRIDTAPPVDLTSPVAGWQKAAPTVTVSGYDAGSGVASVQWSLDGGATTTVAGVSTTVPVTGEGQHTLLTQVTDALGHKSGWKSSTIRVDTTAPANTTPVTDPASWAQGRVAVALDGADGGSGLAGVEYGVDGAPTQLVAQGTVVAVTTDGVHTLRTRAVDVAGNASAWRTDTIQIDSVKPVDTTTVAPTVAYGVKAAITGTDARSGVASVEWKLDGVAGSGPAGSQVALGGAGTHTLAHRVLDVAGNASDWKTDTVVVDPALNNDTTAPTDTTAPPAAWQTTASVTVPVTGTDAQTAVDHVEWRQDGGSPQSGPSGSTVTLTGDGIHHFETRVADLAGNTTPWADRTVKIDATSPTDTTAVPAWQATRAVTLDATDAASGVAAMEWWINGGTKQTGTAGTMITLPSDGTFTLEHRVVDAAGNVSARRTDTVRIDTVAPVDTTPTAPTGWQTTAWRVTPAGTDARSGVDHVEATLDGTAVTTFPVVVDTDGTHTLATRVVDVAGNATAWRSQTVQIDLHAPADTTPAVPAGWLHTAPYTTTVAADDGAGSGVTGIEWKLGSGGTVSTDPAVSIAVEGETQLMTRATDAAGHTSAWRTQTVKIDTGAPTVGLDCGPAGWITSSPACTATADGGPSGIATLSFTRAGVHTTVAPGAKVPVDADGTWTVSLAATDGAGNHAETTGTIKVDRTPPAPAIACVPAAAPTGYACTASATDATSGVAAVRWRVNGGAWQAPAADGTFAIASGSVEVEAVDRAGLTATAPAWSLPVRVVPPKAETRTRSVAVNRLGTHGFRGLLGAFSLTSVRTGSKPAVGTADVRPLSLDAGRFRVTIRLVSGQLTAQRVRTMNFKRGGYSPRMGVALSGVRKPMQATLTVQRKSGRRWRAVAVTKASLKP